MISDTETSLARRVQTLLRESAEPLSIAMIAARLGVASPAIHSRSTQWRERGYIERVRHGFYVAGRTGVPRTALRLVDELSEMQTYVLVQVSYERRTIATLIELCDEPMARVVGHLRFLVNRGLIEKSLEGGASYTATEAGLQRARLEGAHL